MNFKKYFPSLTMFLMIVVAIILDSMVGLSMALRVQIAKLVPGNVFPLIKS